MKISTRKKVVDFKKMLHNDIENDDLVNEQNKNQNLAKKKGQNKKMINGFLGKKRNNSQMHQIAGNQHEKDSRILHQKVELNKNKISKEEYRAILSNYSDEIKQLNLENKNNIIENPSFITSDLSILNKNIFQCTKFENSKPYKMLDYIISNDSFILNRNSDKDKFEDIKKQIFLKGKSDKSDNVNILYKSLYEYFKSDFSTSFISVLFEEINNEIHLNYDKDNNSNNKPKEKLNEDKKDKFTYSHIINDRLKEKKNSLLSYTSDIDFVKSLIYLNNKYNFALNKKNNVDKNLYKDLMDNLNIIKELDDVNKNNIEESNILSSIKKSKSIKKKIKKKFSSFTYCINKIKNVENFNENTFFILIDILTKTKEDDYEKILKLLKEKSHDELNIDRITIKNLFITIRFIFYLKMLSKNSNISSDYLEAGFWKEIFNYVKKRKHLKKANKNLNEQKEKEEDNNKKSPIKPKRIKKKNIDKIKINKIVKDKEKDKIKDKDKVKIKIKDKVKDKDKDKEKGKDKIKFLNNMTKETKANHKTCKNLTSKDNIESSNKKQKEDNFLSDNKESMQDIKSSVVYRFDKGEDIFIVVRESVKEHKTKTPRKRKKKINGNNDNNISLNISHNNNEDNNSIDKNEIIPNTVSDIENESKSALKSVNILSEYYDKNINSLTHNEVNNHVNNNNNTKININRFIQDDDIIVKNSNISAELNNKSSNKFLNIIINKDNKDIEETNS